MKAKSLNLEQLESLVGNIEDFTARAQELSVDEQQKLMQELGIDESMVPLTPKGIDSILGLYNGEDIDNPRLVSIKNELESIMRGQVGKTAGFPPKTNVDVNRVERDDNKIELGEM